MRPREQALLHGVHALSDEGLLTLLLGSTGAASGGVDAVSRRILERFGSLEGLKRADIHELMQVPGIGIAKAGALVAAFELARRSGVFRSKHRRQIRSGHDLFEYLQPMIGQLSQEVFLSIGLDAKHRVLSIKQVAQGGVTSVEVHPRDVFTPLVRLSAAACIVAHNHPSGDPEPSDEDRHLTMRLRRAAELLEIPLLDHLIVSADSFVSMADRGLL